MYILLSFFRSFPLVVTSRSLVVAVHHILFFFVWLQILCLLLPFSFLAPRIQETRWWWWRSERRRSNYENRALVMSQRSVSSWVILSLPVSASSSTSELSLQMRRCSHWLLLTWSPWEPLHHWLSWEHPEKTRQEWEDAGRTTQTQEQANSTREELFVSFRSSRTVQRVCCSHIFSSTSPTLHDKENSRHKQDSFFRFFSKCRVFNSTFSFNLTVKCTSSTFVYSYSSFALISKRNLPSVTLVECSFLYISPRFRVFKKVQTNEAKEGSIKKVWFNN